jgi:hypothetical protein
MTSPKLTTRRLALLSGFALFGVIGAASVCSAESPWRRRVAPPAPPPYRVSLEDDNGAPLPSFQHAGRRYVLGEPGARYNVRVTNPTGERVEVVLTVDGRDSISGRVGDYVSQRGYLIEPWGSLVVEGFRRSMDEVAAFRFTDRGQSYSALRGTPENVGVIGVAVFPEKARPPAPVRPRPRPYSFDDRLDRVEPHASRGADGAGSGAPRRSAQAPAQAPRAEAAPAESSRGYRDYDEPRSKGRSAGPGGPSNIGTQYGEDEASSVVEVAFERRSPTHPAALLTLRYDDYQGLEARGIDLSAYGYGYAYSNQGEPDPFPYSRFAPPPR